jgi:hypothetical protein
MSALATARLDDPYYWLAHCEGFEVQDAVGFLGWVEEVELDPGTRAGGALLVSPSHVRRGTVRVPARAVRLVVPDRGLVFVGSGAAAGHRAYGCGECGYHAAAKSAPVRCPMCGGSFWELVAGPYPPER